MEAVVELCAVNRENGREIVETAKGRRTAPAHADSETVSAAQLYALGSAIKIAANELGSKINSTWLGDAVTDGAGRSASQVSNSLEGLVEKLKNVGVDGGGEPAGPRTIREEK